MAFFKWLLRKRQSKGYGIHSPFAFDLITQIIYSPYSYYAFSDILKKVIHDRDIEHNQVSFRLVNHFKPKYILEVNTGNGVGSFYLLSPLSKINYTCVETDRKKLYSSKETLISYFKSRDYYSNDKNINFVPSFEDITLDKFDAIFINLDSEDNLLPSLKRLFELSNEHCLWVINHINKKRSKQLWRHIVNDTRINITFDYNNKTGIAFLRPAYYKQHFIV